LGIGGLAQSPIPNPQSPIPNPQSPIKIKIKKIYIKLNLIKCQLINLLFIYEKIINLN